MFNIDPRAIKNREPLVDDSRLGSSVTLVVEHSGFEPF